jgi:hypothetical protein
MEGTTTYKATTFADVEKNIDAFEHRPAENGNGAPPASTNGQPPIVATPPVETPTPNGTETPVVVTPPVEENVSTFNLDNGEQGTTQVTTPATPATPAPTTYNWKEEIKKVQEDEVLKEVGLTSFQIELNKHIKNGGDPSDFLSAKALDWTKVSDEDLIKQDYRKQFPNLTSEEVGRLFNRKYGLSDIMNDEDKEDALLQLKADAHIKRQDKIAEQQKFKISEAVPVPKDEEYDAWKENRDAQAQRIQQTKDFITNHTAIKTLHESKRVTVNVGEGIAPFNFSVDKPELITQTLTDDGTSWGRLTSTKTGEPDVEKQQLLTLFAHNPQKFIQDIFGYGMSYGRKKVVEEGQNAHLPNRTVPGGNIDAKPTYGQGRYGDKSRE